MTDIEVLGKIRCRYNLFDAKEQRYYEALSNAIQALSSAVPVVRCKDCQYSREPNRHDRDEKAACEGVLICCVGFDHVYPSAYDGLLFTDESDYCSKGERREEDNDER